MYPENASVTQKSQDFSHFSINRNFCRKICRPAATNQVQGCKFFVLFFSGLVVSKGGVFFIVEKTRKKRSCLQLGTVFIYSAAMPLRNTLRPSPPTSGRNPPRLALLLAAGSYLAPRPAEGEIY